VKIIKTSIPDVTETNLNEAKLALSNNIINNIYPLFDDIIESKLKDTDNLEIELKRLRQIVLGKKSELEKLIKEMGRKQKISKLLYRLEKLIKSGLIYDGSLKGEIILLLRVVMGLDEKRLDLNLENSMKILSKRFASS